MTRGGRSALQRVAVIGANAFGFAETVQEKKVHITSARFSRAPAKVQQPGGRGLQTTNDNGKLCVTHTYTRIKNQHNVASLQRPNQELTRLLCSILYCCVAAEMVITSAPAGSHTMTQLMRHLQSRFRRRLPIPHSVVVWKNRIDSTRSGESNW